MQRMDVQEYYWMRWMILQWIVTILYEHLKKLNNFHIPSVLRYSNHILTTLFREDHISVGSAMGLYQSKVQSYYYWTDFSTCQFSPLSNGNYTFNFALVTIQPLTEKKKEILSMNNYHWHTFYYQNIVISFYLPVELDLFKIHHYNDFWYFN